MKFGNTQEARQPHLQSVLQRERAKSNSWKVSKMLPVEIHESHRQTHTLGLLWAQPPCLAHSLCFCAHLSSTHYKEAYFVQGARLDANLTDYLWEGHGL